MKHKVQITEYLQTVVEIEADTPEEALRIADNRYANSLITLDYNDFVDYEINILEEENNGTQQQLT